MKMYFLFKHGDIPASYVIVYQRVNQIMTFPFGQFIATSAEVTPKGSEQQGNPGPKMAERFRLRIYFINCPDSVYLEASGKLNFIPID